MVTALCACALWLHVNGLSWHPNDRTLNETNMGAGLSVETFDTGEWHGAAGFDMYRDSNDQDSGHFGHTIKRRFGPVSLGVVVGVIHRKDLRDNTGREVLPFGVPVASIGTDRIRARFTYIPPVENPSQEVVAAQIQVRL